MRKEVRRIVYDFPVRTPVQIRAGDVEQNEHQHRADQQADDAHPLEPAYIEPMVNRGGRPICTPYTYIYYELAHADDNRKSTHSPTPSAGLPKKK